MKPDGQRTMLYFGSFNPVHSGHIAIAEYVVTQGIADTVVLVVSPQNPFKDADGLAPELERFEAAERAAAASKFPDKILVSAIEFTLPRPSYTIDTLRFLEAECPGARFSILMGGDNAEKLREWKNADEILGRYPIFVYPRPGNNAAKFPAGVTVLEGAPLMDISSTEIRRKQKFSSEMGRCCTDRNHEEQDSTFSTACDER